MMLANREFDKSLEEFSREVCEAIKEDLKVIGSKKVRRPDSLVDRHGKVKLGYINFKEFEKIYMLHVHPQIEDHYNVKKVEENKLLQLFNMIDPDQRGFVNKAAFTDFVEKNTAVPFLQRLKSKALRGSNRLMHSIKIICDEADIHINRNG